jgi:hypothetical protein
MLHIKIGKPFTITSYIVLSLLVPSSVFGRTIAQYEYVQVQSQDRNTTSALIDYTHKKVCVVVNSNNQLTAKEYKLSGNGESFIAGNKKYKVTGGKLDVPASHYELIDNGKKCGDPIKCILTASITAYHDYRFQKRAELISKGNIIKFLGMENNSPNGKASNIEYQGQSLYGKGKPSCKI